jgi:hypothetical protein
MAMGAVIGVAVTEEITEDGVTAIAVGIITISISSNVVSTITMMRGRMIGLKGMMAIKTGAVVKGTTRPIYLEMAVSTIIMETDNAMVIGMVTTTTTANGKLLTQIPVLPQRGHHKLITMVRALPPKSSR